ncbi:hypothetical protein WOC76_19795 [Methylocystis sp. IM3]|uniref:hypothetical protein n=1 Tax=Methylocystis sp. IM3 TaxID=3136722 RepID=UPI000F8FE09B|nr:MAG: hypothetical protein EKK29_21035 [Hyphomicrobiales bacterium]
MDTNHSAIPPSRTRLRFVTGERWDFFAPFIAPFLLVTIAVSQLIFSSRHPAFSTWKGGGFGMFSKLDSPDDRLVRVFLVTEGGDIPAPLPAEEERRFEQLSATGSESLAKSLARTLFEGRWVAPVEQCRPASPGEQAPPASRIEGGASAKAAPAAPVRMLKSGENQKPGESSIIVKGLRLELWKLDFHKASLTLGVQKLMEAHVSASEPGTP